MISYGFVIRLDNGHFSSVKFGNSLGNIQFIEIVVRLQLSTHWSWFFLHKA